LLLQAIVDLADMMKFSMFKTGTHLIHIPFCFDFFSWYFRVSLMKQKVFVP